MPACTLKKLPDVCARIDDILKAVCDPVEAVDAAFADYLDVDTIKAIENRYPIHQRDCTSDKTFLNMVMAEVCCAEI
jgi:hypothetical protein